MLLPNKIESKLFSFELMKRLVASTVSFAWHSFIWAITISLEAVIPKAKTPPHATGLHSARAPGAKNEDEKPNWPAGLESNVREKPVIT
jgi:hypothetical protein